MTTNQLSSIREYTQHRLRNWYIDAATDYQVDGSGSVYIDEHNATIVYTENGVAGSFTMPTACIEDEEVAYLFNCWSEQA